MIFGTIQNTAIPTSKWMPWWRPPESLPMLEHITMDSGGKERAAVSRRAFLLQDIKNGRL